MNSPGRYSFPKSHHLRRQRDYQRVYGTKLIKRMGPIRVHGAPNDLGHNRLGLSVGRRVGKAVVRNRIRRRLREAFRLLQHDLPQGYDLVVVVLPHEPRELAEYQRMLHQAAEAIDRQRQRRDAASDGSP